MSHRDFIMADKSGAASCDTCINYVYDEDYEDYFCEANMDEDDYGRLMSDGHFDCPFYQLDNEYLIVRHQM